jgi:flavin reductase (DIM6/NTAB) family NADH-FMN oxidoreductase RutF
MTASTPQAHVSVEHFRALLGRFASGVTIVTAADDRERPHGMTVSAFSSLSIEPPLVLVCIDAAASMQGMFVVGSFFAVNVLAADQEPLSRRFSDEAMELRFDGVPWAAGATGAPLLVHAHARLECRCVQRHVGGDHVIVIGQVVHGDTPEGTAPLLYHRGAYGSLAR